MTDFPAGGPTDRSEPALCAENETPAFELLRRLAAALGLPVGAFLEQAPHPGPAPSAVLIETASLLAAFSRISCPAARRRCIDLVESAGRSEEAS